ncbi:trans-resveratrol di-O-methyltransferase-like [Coffea eugenioides]|uniref:trans-resveratrol di-O-methyltransferase-like n=1 Tax=Coffea eugenioides TaxID=49369 RepID=UPI000F615984|nr:trans-resveratrol di-O-methyltransferase-like [Coffea eugenioides]
MPLVSVLTCYKTGNHFCPTCKAIIKQAKSLIRKVAGMNRAENLTELLEAQNHVGNQMLNFRKSASLKCAIELGIPDAINQHGKPITLSELVSALPINPSKANHIYRLMRFLSNAGFFVLQDHGYALTAAGRLLLKEEPFNLRAFIFYMSDPVLVKPWNSLTEWFRNDDPSPFHTAHGKNFWAYAAEEPNFANLFNESMANDSTLIVQVMMTECKFVFDGLTSLVDVGGGTGAVARAIAQNFPNMECVVCDLPHVIAGQEGTENLDFVAGDMLEKVPAADAILLKWILHDWSDEDCVKILKNCKEAIPGRDKGGKVIIIDMIMESQMKDGESVETQVGVDMQMLMCYGAKERTEKEWAKLFQDAGFSDYKVLPVLGVCCLIEVYP